MGFEDFLVGFGLACVLFLTKWILSESEESNKIVDEPKEEKKVVQVINVAEKYKDGIREIIPLVTTAANKKKLDKIIENRELNL